MKSSVTLGVLILALGSGAVLGQQLEKWGYPNPDEFAKATLVLCQEQRDSVILATRLRAEGRKREEVLALIPENPPRLELRAVDVYRENVEDVFQFPEYGLYSMLVFRAEVCRKEVMAARTLPRFSTVREKVGACESRHGKERSNELYACIRGIVEGMR